jgi:hypothetical protein
MKYHHEYQEIYKNWNCGSIFDYFLSRYDRSSRFSIEEGIDAKKNKAREKIWKENRKESQEFEKESQEFEKESQEKSKGRSV